MIILAITTGIICIIASVLLTPFATAMITMCPEGHQQLLVFFVMCGGLLGWFVPPAYAFSGLILNGVIL